MNKLYCETHLTFVKRRICCKLISTYINANRTYIKRQTNRSSKNAANRGRRLTRSPQGVGGQVNKHRKSLPCRARCPAPLLQRTLVIFPAGVIRRQRGQAPCRVRPQLSACPQQVQQILRWWAYRFYRRCYNRIESSDSLFSLGSRLLRWHDGWPAPPCWRRWNTFRRLTDINAL